MADKIGTPGTEGEMTKMVEAVGLVVDCGDGRWAFVIQADGQEFDRLIFDTEEEANRAFNDFGMMIAGLGSAVH